MMQIVQQTQEERVKMYMKLTKQELAQMLATRDGLFYPSTAACAAITWSEFRNHTGGNYPTTPTY